MVSAMRLGGRKEAVFALKNQAVQDAQVVLFAGLSLNSAIVNHLHCPRRLRTGGLKLAKFSLAAAAALVVRRARQPSLMRISNRETHQTQIAML